ncbi:MAG: hypothetical protein WAK93_03495 [Solirubrobacteraceae bacterium]
MALVVVAAVEPPADEDAAELVAVELVVLELPPQAASIKADRSIAAAVRNR